VIVGRANLNPVLATVTPPVAAPLDTLTLDGSGFAQPASANQVAFVTSSGAVTVPAASVDASGTELTVQAPQGLVLGSVKVVVNGLASNGQRLVPAGVPAITSLSPAQGGAGDEVQLRGVDLSATAQVFVGGVPATITLADIQPPDGRLVFKVPAGAVTGPSTVTVKVGTQTSAPFAFVVADTPTAVITSPQDSAEVLGPTTIVGTASNPTTANFVSYSLTLTREAPGGTATTIASGNTPVVNGPLGTIDPTLLVNGFYTLTLTVTNKFGKQAVVEVASLQVRGDQKVGVFTLAFQDITLKANGFNVVVNRTYDSREKRVQDFGVGWKLTLSNVDMETDLGNNVFLTLPDGKREVFVFDPQPTGDPTIFTTQYDPSPGVFDVLTIPGIDNQQLFLVQGTFFTIAGAPFDPTDVTLTRVDGTVLQINQLAGLQSITDTNGNTVNFSANGITGVGATLPFQRDSIGRITTITDPAGRTISYQYSDTGDLVGVIDRVGNKTTITYDTNHNLIDIISPSGIRAARSDYDGTGRLIGMTDPDGNKTLFAHDLTSRTDTITDRLGHTRTVQYDQNGDVVAQTDQLGNQTKFERDANRNQTATIDALGNRWTHTYNSQGRALTDTDPLGNTTTRTYDANGHLLTAMDALGNTSTNTYDASGNLSTTKDALGNLTRFAYYKGSLTSQTDALGNTTTFQNDARGNVTLVTDALGHQTQYVYDALGNQTQGKQGTLLSEFAFVSLRTTTANFDATGRITTTVNALGNASGTVYDQDGHQRATIDALGRQTTFGYDDRGNQTSAMFPDGTSVSETFDAEARRITSTDRIGRVTSFVYDATGRVTDTISPDATSTHMDYDAVGRITTETNARGFKTSFVYDAAGRRIKVIDALGRATISAYDAVGNVISVTDARGNTTGFGYDALNRHVKTIFPNGTFVRTVYNALGQKFQEIDQAGKVTQFQYDALNRKAQIVSATGAITSFVYDQLSNLIERHDPLGRVTRFDHDALGHITKTTRPLGMSATVAYDEIGRVISSTDFNGQTTTLAYDAASRLKHKALPDGRTVDFTYTPTGRRLTIADSVRGITTYGYDLRDRLLSRIEPDGYVVSYGYDANGNRTSVTAPSGTTSYTFDALDRMETVTSASGQVSRYGYDEVGNRKTLSYPNGVVATYAYDNLNRLTNLTNATGTTVLSAFTYTLGPTGNRTQVVEANGRVVGYSYDDDYQLTVEAITDPGNQSPLVLAYSYDSAGNRLTKTQINPNGSQQVTTYHYDNNDRLNEEDATSGVTTYSYDNDGSTTQMSSPGQVKAFTWTPERRLAAATITGTGATQASFEYDEDGIRVKKVKNGVGTRYVIDQVQAFQEVVEERDVGSGTLNVAYTYGDDLISQDRGGTRRFYATDGQLSTRQLTDDNGVITDGYTYEAFGTLLTSSGVTPNAYLYTGQQEDTDVGGYYLRARYFANASGRFLSEDFVDRDGLSYHKYLYVRGNPVNHIDLRGLEADVGEELGKDTIAFVTVAGIGQALYSAVPALFAISVPIILGEELSAGSFQNDPYQRLASRIARTQGSAGGDPLGGYDQHIDDWVEYTKDEQEQLGSVFTRRREGGPPNDVYEGEGEGQVWARLDIGGRTFYGYNGMGLSNPWRAGLGINARSPDHAEGQVFIQAYTQHVRSSDAELTVTWPPCPSCGLRRGIENMARTVGVRRLTLILPAPWGVNYLNILPGWNTGLWTDDLPDYPGRPPGVTGNYDDD
jgi:RHS repeat-associated protein